MTPSDSPRPPTTPQVSGTADDTARGCALREEQRLQWERGDRVLVEAYCQRHPYLDANPEVLLDLIYHEILLREERHEQPRLEEYAQRFPRFASELSLQFEVHRALRASLLAGRESPASPLTMSKAEGRPELPGFEILGTLGEGGMGVVYQALQLALKRLVAIKLIRGGPTATPHELARFRVEAEAVAQLQHPNIVQVFEVGAAGGQPYLVLEFVEGGSLSRKLAGQPLPDRQAAELILTLARAIDTAHQRGVVHRDLKPANILLTADGQPKIADFGLAKRPEQEGLTQTGAIVGTPSYMAPEQTAGNAATVGPRADVYALGAILYELLTGRPPFRGATPLDTLAQVRSQEPVPPRRLQPKVGRDLETICLKCLHKEQGKRYAGAVELAEDVQRYLAGTPIQARPAGPGERLWKWARRRPAVAALTGVSATATVLLLAGLLIGLVLLADKQEATETALGDARCTPGRKNAALQGEQQATTAKETALQKEREARKKEGGAYYDSVALAYLALAANDVTLADQILGDCPSVLRGWEWHYLHRQCHAAWATLAHAGSPAHSATFNADGPLLAVGHWDGTVSVWDVAARKLRYQITGHVGVVDNLAFSPNGAYLASGSYPRAFMMSPSPKKNPPQYDHKICDAATGKVIHHLKVGANIKPAFSPDSKRMASAGDSFGCHIWDIETGKELPTAPNLAGLGCVAWSKDGRWIAASGPDKTIKIFEADTGKIKYILAAQKAAVQRLVFHPDSVRLYAVGYDGALHVWSVLTGVELGGYRGLPLKMDSLTVSGDGQLLAFAEGERAAKVVMADTGLPFAVFRGPTDIINAVALSQDGKRLACACKSGSVTIWDVTSPQEYGVLHRADKSINSVLPHPDSRRLFLGTIDGSAALVNIAERNVLVKYEALKFVATLLALSPDSKQVAVVHRNRFKITEVETGATVRRFETKTLGGSQVAWHPSGKSLAVAHTSSFVVDVATGAEVDNLALTKRYSWGLRISPNGSYLAVVAFDGTLQLWTSDGARLLFTLGTPFDPKVSRLLPMGAAAFSADSRFLAGNTPAGIVIWKVADGQPVLALRTSGAKVTSLAFSPDGTRLAAATSASTDASDVRVWDTATGHELVKMRQPQKKIIDLAFTADGHRLIGAGGNEVLCWDATPVP